MVCGSYVRNTALLLVVLLLAYSCVQLAYSQEAVQDETKLLDELEGIIEQQEKRIQTLEESLRERVQALQRLKTLLAQNKRALEETQQLLRKQSVILAEHEPLFKRYERSARGAAIEAGLLGGIGGVLLGLVGGVLSTYYITR